MHLRALIVLLLVMNVGVALWWALRPAPAAEQPPALPADVPRLLLASEADAEALQAVQLNAANADVQADGPLADGSDAAAVAPEDLRCFSFGPWTDPGEAEEARVLLQTQVVRIITREAPTGVTGWRVMMPVHADREAAQETVARLVEAGFDDHFIIGQGEEANAVALGRFSAETSARRHEAALREAGFEAMSEPLGATGAEAWVDLAAGPDFDPGQAREDTGAARAEPADCAQLQ